MQLAPGVSLRPREPDQAEAQGGAPRSKLAVAFLPDDQGPGDYLRGSAAPSSGQRAPAV